MALETLKDVIEIDGFEVVRIAVPEGKYPEFKPDSAIFINDYTNTIAFKIQDGPIKEVGMNGCQLDALIHAASKLIEGLNKKFPCDEYKIAMEHLDRALVALKVRKMKRESRGVEGTSKA